jgi:hypothetical protein
MSIPLSTLSTRAGVLMYPSEAAQVLENNPPNSTHPVITDEVLATRAGCLMYPSIAAGYIDELSDSSSSSS